MKKDRKERIAVVAGVRSPFIKAGGDLSKSSADNLGTHVLKELLKEEWIDKSKIDEVIIGNVAQPAHAANIARVIALNAGLNKEIPDFNVHRYCASGMESVSSAAYKLRCNDAKLIIAGGTESMSNIPFLFTPELKYILESLSKAKTIKQKLKIIKHIKLKYLKPIIGLIQGLTDPTCNMIMGITAENIVREFKITREEQDRYSLESHQKAIKGEANRKEEICPIPTLPNYSKILTKDDGPRKEQT
ncbi:MAG: thiolase family protein [bacterium]